MFFLGQFVSSSLSKGIRSIYAKFDDRQPAYFVISLASTIRLSSLTTRGPIHTCVARSKKVSRDESRVWLTFFANQTVVSVVGVVGISQSSMRVFKLEEFVAMFARMSSTESQFSISKMVVNIRNILVSVNHHQ